MLRNSFKLIIFCLALNQICNAGLVTNRANYDKNLRTKRQSTQSLPSHLFKPIESESERPVQRTQSNDFNTNNTLSQYNESNPGAENLDKFLEKFINDPIDDDTGFRINDNSNIQQQQYYKQSSRQISPNVQQNYYGPNPSFNRRPIITRTFGSTNDNVFQNDNSRQFFSNSLPSMNTARFIPTPVPLIHSGSFVGNGGSGISSGRSGGCNEDGQCFESSWSSSSLNGGPAQVQRYEYDSRRGFPVYTSNYESSFNK